MEVWCRPMGLWCWFAIGCAWYRLIFFIVIYSQSTTSNHHAYPAIGFLFCLFVCCSYHITTIAGVFFLTCSAFIIRKTLVKMQHYCQTHSVHNNIVILLEILFKNPRRWFIMSHICKGVWIPYPPRVFDRFQCSPDNDTTKQLRCKHSARVRRIPLPWNDQHTRLRKEAACGSGSGQILIPTSMSE